MLDPLLMGAPIGLATCVAAYWSARATSRRGAARASWAPLAAVAVSSFVILASIRAGTPSTSIAVMVAVLGGCAAAAWVLRARSTKDGDRHSRAASSRASPVQRAAAGDLAMGRRARHHQLVASSTQLSLAHVRLTK